MGALRPGGRCCSVLLLVLVALAAPVSARADQAARQFANLIFQPPPGWAWDGQRADGRVELAYKGGPGRCKNCMIVLDKGNRTAWPIEAWQEALARTFFEDTTPVSPPQRMWERLGGWPVHILARQARDDGGQDTFQVFFAIGLPQRHELLGFTAEVNSQAELNRAIGVINADVLPMIARMRYESQGAAPLIGLPVPGNLRGPWYGSQLYNRYNGLTGSLELALDTELYTFFPGGRFYRGVPPSGTGPINYQALVRAGELGLGNYRVVGDKIVLRFADGPVGTLQMIGGNAIRSGRVTMYQKAVPPAGYRFDGTIHSVSYTGFSTGLGSTGGVSSEHTQVFRKDGTVIDSLFVGVSGSDPDGGGFSGGEENPKAVGRYQVQNGRIVITPPTGDPLSTWILFDGGTNLVIGGKPVE